MPSLPPSADQSVLATAPQRPLSVEDYHRMIAAGVFDEDERIELLEGVIVRMSPQSPRHARIMRRLCDPLFAAVPDVAIVLRADTDAPDRHPSTALLVFEVAGDSIRKDRLAKAGLYARADVPEYVIVNLVENCLEVHRDPDRSARRYRTVTTLTKADRFESQAVAGFRFAVLDLLA